MATETKHTDTKKEEVKAPANTQPQVEIDPIQVGATNCPTFRDSLILVLESVAGEINANKDNPDTVAKVAARLRERAGTYADAVVANTGYAGAYEVETEKGKAEREAKEKEHKEAKK